jgi:ABC-2 type transport system ATP-binding protein
MTAAIEIVELTKVFKVGFARKRTVTALENLSLEVGEGEVFGFLGPNGAGKTTTLKLLTRLIRPTSGTARILGESIDSVAMHRWIGYLPEQAYFYDYLTARELLWYFGRLTGVDNHTLSTRVDETLDRVGLDRKAFDRQLRKFSKGMLQRVGLAQAIVNDPKVVFFDEPMSGLDPIGRRQVRDLIVELREAGKTVFFSTHILADVEALCDRVAILNAGRLVETGRLADILVARTGSLEIVATGLDDAAVDAVRAEGFAVTRSPGGVHIQIAGEAEIEPALARLRPHGGRVISINQTRSSLEDLFMREVAGQESGARSQESGSELAS